MTRFGSGWCQSDGKLTIDWMRGEPAPKAVLDPVSVRESANCRAVPVSVTDCIVLACVSYKECTNQSEEATEDLTADDSDVECEDDCMSYSALKGFRGALT